MQTPPMFQVPFSNEKQSNEGIWALKNTWQNMGKNKDT